MLLVLAGVIIWRGVTTLVVVLEMGEIVVNFGLEGAAVNLTVVGIGVEGVLVVGIVFLVVAIVDVAFVIGVAFVVGVLFVVGFIVVGIKTTVVIADLGVDRDVVGVTVVVIVDDGVDGVETETVDIEVALVDEGISVIGSESVESTVGKSKQKQIIYRSNFQYKRNTTSSN